MKGCGIKLTIDYAFKRIFGVEKNKDILIALLNGVLLLKGKNKIKDITILNPFQEKDYDVDKLSILDIKAIDNSFQNYDIEVQVEVPSNYPKRILYYASKLYSSQINEGESYNKLKPVISISFLEHSLFKDTPNYINRFNLINKENSLTLSKDFEFYIFELSKFDLNMTEINNSQNEWLYLVKHSEEIDPSFPPKIFSHNKVFKKILRELDFMNKTDIERIKYEDRIKAQRDIINWQELGYLEGHKKGLEKGKEEGRKEGKEEGRKEGKEEGRKEGIDLGKKEGIIEEKLEIAKKMLKKGFDIETISSLTGLTKEQIIEIQK